MIVTIVCSVVASGGFWTFLQSHKDKHDAKTKLLLGLAHDRIMYLSGVYIDRGYITKDEYENLHDYLYIPYAANGGNGTAKKAMGEIDKLPLHDHVQAKR